jgi:putative holliday junction resolvase
LTNFAPHFTERSEHLSENELPDAKSSEQQTRDDARVKPAGRLMALDLGQKRVGVAVSDELRMTARPLPFLRRTNWKQLLGAVAELIRGFDAKGLVIGLPLNLDGTVGDAAREARRVARNFELSLKIPIYLQDERLTSREAEEALLAAGRSVEEIRREVDGESAVIILLDFIAQSEGP